MNIIHNRIGRSIFFIIFILVACIFFANLVPVREAETQEAGEIQQAQPPPVLVTEPLPEPERPPDGAVIDHPLPEDPIITDGPWASAHFLMAEYACDCAGYCDGWPAEMDPELLERVEALRCCFDRPVIITSGVRCEERNAEVGGIENSWHLSGHAADLYCPGVPCDVVAAAARELGLGVIEYPDRQFDHVEIWK